MSDKTLTYVSPDLNQFDPHVTNLDLGISGALLRFAETPTGQQAPWIVQRVASICASQGSNAARLWVDGLYYGKGHQYFEVLVNVQEILALGRSATLPDLTSDKAADEAADEDFEEILEDAAELFTECLTDVMRNVSKDMLRGTGKSAEAFAFAAAAARLDALPDGGTEEDVNREVARLLSKPDPHCARDYDRCRPIDPCADRLLAHHLLVTEDEFCSLECSRYSARVLNDAALYITQEDAAQAALRNQGVDIS